MGQPTGLRLLIWRNVPSARPCDGVRLVQNNPASPGEVRAVRLLERKPDSFGAFQ
jgi:hypothetical protein